jgi:hypothetical protein
MIPWLCTIPLLLLQPAAAPLPVVDAKDLPPAARGPLAPRAPDRGVDGSMLSTMRHRARQAGLPALQLPSGSVRVKDKVPDISGWRAYAIEVPAGESVRVQVVEGRRAWFRVLGVNAWGELEEGLLQNRIPSGEPRASYKNPKRETRTIYFIVDTLDANMLGEEFEVEVIRN